MITITPKDKTSTSMLTTRAGKAFGFLPISHACEGSVVLRTFVGLTSAHARLRAERWLATVS